METLSKEKRTKVIKALTKTLNAYEDLIKNPKANLIKWAGFGSTSACNICIAMEYNTVDDYSKKCAGCPLSCREPEEFCGAPCVNESFVVLENTLRNTTFNIEVGICRVKDIDKDTLDKLKEAAKKRYDWIIKKLDSLGYEFK